MQLVSSTAGNHWKYGGPVRRPFCRSRSRDVGRWDCWTFSFICTANNAELVDARSLHVGRGDEHCGRREASGIFNRSTGMRMCFTSLEAMGSASIQIKFEFSLLQEAPFEIPECKPRKTWPENGEVVFTSYQTRYRPGLELVLRDVTCTIKPSEKVA